MSQNRKRKRTRTGRGSWLAAPVATIALAGLIAPASAGDRKAPANPPGVIIEPPRPGRDASPLPDPNAPDQDQREGSGGGCPANDKKLELIV